jgi:hypothetical protein
LTIEKIIQFPDRDQKARAVAPKKGGHPCLAPRPDPGNR